MITEPRHSLSVGVKLSGLHSSLLLYVTHALAHYHIIGKWASALNHRTV